MTVKDKILVILSAIGSVFSAVFFVLFRQAKEEKQEAEIKAANEAAAKKRIEEQTEKYVEEQKENEDLIQRATSGNNANSANASLELLHNISAKGKARNKPAEN